MGRRRKSKWWRQLLKQIIKVVERDIWEYFLRWGAHLTMHKILSWNSSNTWVHHECTAANGYPWTAEQC